jgi:hypothetical protein
MGDVSRLLSQRIDNLVAELFPAAKRVGHEWCVGSLAGEPGNSLAIHTGGTKSGVWADFSTGERGDALELVAKAICGGDRLQALAWALSFLGVNDGKPPPRLAGPAPACLARREMVQPVSQAWRRILTECTPAAGTLAERYLASRGLRLPVDDYDSVLRFHPACPRGAGRYPAMIGVMTDPVTNEPVGVHRTFLAPDGNGKARIPLPPDENGEIKFASAKMTLGRGVIPGVIRLTADEDATQGLGICEGIETGLAIIQHAGWKPIWKVSGTSGMASFPVLAGIECLTVFADHDAPRLDGKQPGLDSARECAARWQSAGREVEIKLPPPGMDWDDSFKRVAS